MTSVGIAKSAPAISCMNCSAKELQELLDVGALTKEEFDIQKAFLELQELLDLGALTKQEFDTQKAFLGIR